MRLSDSEWRSIVNRRNKPRQTQLPSGTSGPTDRVLALGRLKPGEMNRTERDYDAHLAWLFRSGEVVWYKFEGVKLRLANNTFYTPDFFVMFKSGAIECHEVKGFWKDDARAKIKIAAAQFPFRFIAVTARKKKDGGGWQVEEF